MDEYKFSSIRIWNMFPYITLDNMVILVCYWVYLHMEWCEIVYYFSICMAMSLDLTEDIYVNHRSRKGFFDWDI